MILAELIQEGRVWRAQDAPVRPEKPLFPSGFPELDACLGGWMPGQLIELLVDQPGSGELSVLLPMLARQSQQSGLILWVDPPVQPYPLALAQAGVQLQDHRVIRSKTLGERLWVLEQALKSGCVSVALGWFDRVPDKALRRLQLAAQQGGGLAFVLRSSDLAQQSSPAAYRLHLRMTAEGVQVDIIKRRQAWPVAGPLLVPETIPFKRAV